ncbi:hypothetical protein AVEN_100622-1 [Araneus ventricosus]|uniref:Uncharacterized protein n=1 Tax=Araneus ventricosus TaxID=182803 RepID=A0A4Y2E6I0_ARAVE|nr:hypothetical protein AVEN_100622-1 [Araneus ventricosus]
MKFGAYGLKVVEFQGTQNPKLHSPIPVCDFDARVAGEQRICLHWDLASRRLEMKLEIPNVGRRRSGVDDFSIDLPNKKVFVTSSLSADTILETLKKSGKETTYVGVKA